MIFSIFKFLSEIVTQYAKTGLRGPFTQFDFLILSYRIILEVYKNNPSISRDTDDFPMCYYAWVLIYQNYNFLQKY